MVSSERDEATAITGARRERESRPDRSGAPDIAPRDDACSHRRVLPPSQRRTRFLEVGALSHSCRRAPSPSPASRAVAGAGVVAAPLASEFAEPPAKGTLRRQGRSRERGWRWGRGLWTDLPVGLLHDLPLAERVLLRLARLEHQHRAPQVAARRLGDALRERRREREALLARDRLPASQPDPTTQFELLNCFLCLNTADGPLGERRGLRRRETNAGTGERTRRKRENKCSRRDDDDDVTRLKHRADLGVRWRGDADPEAARPHRVDHLARVVAAQDQPARRRVSRETPAAAATQRRRGGSDETPSARARLSQNTDVAPFRSPGARARDLRRRSPPTQRAECASPN